MTRASWCRSMVGEAYRGNHPREKHPEGSPRAALRERTTMPLRLLSGGRRLGLPRTAQARLEGTDSELHQLIAGEPEAPPQVGRHPAAQDLALLLHLLAAVNEILELAPTGLLLAVQALR